MIDLVLLRPRDDSAGAIADALGRCDVAARGLAAEIARMREARAGLLLKGTYEALIANGNELARALQDGVALDELIDRLKAMSLTAATNPVQAEVAARLEMLNAVNLMSAWWATHGAQLTAGYSLCKQAADALATWQAAAHRVAELVHPPAATNVTPIGPRPTA